VVECPPLDSATEAKMEPNFLMKSVGERAPARGLPVKHPLMHRTRSLDYAVVLSGEIDMMLDDSLVHLKPGDVVVQQATNHGWINRGTQPCRILFVLMDSKQPNDQRITASWVRRMSGTGQVKPGSECDPPARQVYPQQQK
jgi:mannose-6-phosphate isomerase-like protein (cupin superfamily)